MQEPHPRFGDIVQTHVRVVSWNVWWRFGPWQARQPAVAATLAELDADVICLQEAWEHRGDSQPRALADALGLNYAFAARYDFAGHRLGNAILSRWPITASEHIPLPCPPSREEFRLCLRADIDGPRGALQVYTAHVHHKLADAAIRIGESTAIAQFVADTHLAELPPIVCADFNATPDADSVRMLTGRAPGPVPDLCFNDAWDLAGEGPGLTWDNRNPFAAQELEAPRRLDYILVGEPVDGGRGHVKAVRLAGVDPVDGVLGSDHYAVVADIRY